MDDLIYKKELDKKLEEELSEYIADKTVEKLADLTEVFRAILKYKNISIEEFEKIREKKVI
ncbi:MAG: hypothetical protein WCJ19_05150 [bacterium]